MPCYDPRDHERTVEVDRTYNGLKGSQLEAILCGVLGAVDRTFPIKAIFDSVRWDEVGVSRTKAEQWWTRHQEEDRRRAARAAARAQEQAVKEAALKKLTAQERRILGLR